MIAVDGNSTLFHIKRTAVLIINSHQQTVMRPAQFITQRVMNWKSQIELSQIRNSWQTITPFNPIMPYYIPHHE